jgi:hydrogenase maturation protease
LPEEGCGITAIFCVGNYYLSDDGFAIHLFRVLKGLSLPEDVEIYETALMGFNQIEYIRPYRKLLIIDAVKGLGAPGDIFKLDLINSPPAFQKAMLSAHDIGVLDMLELVRVLSPENLPKEVILIGVEAADTMTYGTDLSPMSAAALPVVKSMVLEEIQN